MTKIEKPIRVLVLLPNLRPSNGVSSFIMNYYRRLDYSKIQMDFALYYDRETPYYAEIKASGGSRIYILENIKNYSKHVRQCRRILSEGGYDVIHDNTLLISWPMMYEAKKMGIPIRILHSHNAKLGETEFKEVRNRTFLFLLKKTANRYVACTRAAGKAMFGNESFSLVPNIIDGKKYFHDSSVREDFRKQMNVQDKQVILTVGRVAKQKNPFFAIAVIEELYKMNQNIEYWWVGSGPLDREVHDYIKARNMIISIRMLGSENNVQKYYQAADVFFMPSLFEGLALVLVETQAAGLPSVISDVIPEEAYFTDLLHPVSLQESLTVWARALNDQLEKKIDREKYKEIFLHSKFTDSRALETMTALYSNTAIT